MKRETKKTLGIALVGLMGINLTGSALAMQPGDHLASLTQKEPSMNYLDSIERNQKCNVLSQAGATLAATNAFNSNQKSHSILDKGKNATNYIIDTIKSDLGLQARINRAESANVDLAKSVRPAINLGFLEGCRLFAYKSAIIYLLEKLLINIAPNFVSEVCCAVESENNLLDRINIVEYVIRACIVAPIQEEAFFTYFASTILGPLLGRTMLPLLFGLAHYHPNPKAYLLHTLSASTSSIIYTSNHYGHINRGSISLAPIWAHALWNASAIYPKVLRELKGQ